MKILGMCGGSGAGKGYVCSVFAAHGIPAIDTDGIYHRMTERSSPCTRELEACFGPSVIRPDGSLDRAALAAIVFAPDGADKRKKLNAITHKYIRIETEKEIERYRAEGCPAVIVDAPALFESGFDQMCHAVIGVFAPREERIRRIVARDGISRARAEARLSGQLTDEQLAPLCHYRIHNGGEDVERQVLSIISHITE